MHFLCLLLISFLIVSASAGCSSSTFVDTPAGDSIPTSPPITAQPPADLITQESELVQSFLPSGPDPNPRSSCPWAEADLRNWHNPSTWPSGIPVVRCPACLFIRPPFDKLPGWERRGSALQHQSSRLVLLVRSRWLQLDHHSCSSSSDLDRSFFRTSFFAFLISPSLVFFIFLIFPLLIFLFTGF